MAERERAPIIGFWHVCMINHWERIVNLQLNIILNSLLYRNCEKIYIGCVGSDEDLKKLNSIISSFDKIEIKAHDNNLLRYEFITLSIVQRLSEDGEPFYGFYIHTKGCSYPNNEGGKYWLDYMNYYNLTKWRDCVAHLDLGYDLCGVKLLSARECPALKMHYSGNFFWFYSVYISDLVSISKLDHKNRFDAEMWVCSNSPIAATLCQEFVDYNTKGIFKP